MVSHTALAAGTYVFGKAATMHFPVLALGLFRFLVGTAGFLLLMRYRGKSLAPLFREDGRSFFLAGFLGVVLNQVGFLWGLKLTLPSHGALLYALSPLLVLLYGWMKGAERPTTRKLAGIGLAFTGVILLFLLQRRDIHLPPHWLLGDLLLLVAVGAWAAFSIQTRPLVLKHGSEAATAAAILAGTLLFLPLGLVGVFQFTPGAAPASAWYGALYLGLITTLVMYLLWFKALGMKEPSRVAIVQNGQPVFTALLAWAVYGTAPGWEFALGAGLVFTGVVITQL